MWCAERGVISTASHIQEQDESGKVLCWRDNEREREQEKDDTHRQTHTYTHTQAELC